MIDNHDKEQELSPENISHVVMSVWRRTTFQRVLHGTQDLYMS